MGGVGSNNLYLVLSV